MTPPLKSVLSYLVTECYLESRKMGLSKKKTAGILLGSATLLTSTYFTLRRYIGYKQLKSELDSIPWDIPKKYTSWKLFLNNNPKK